MTATRAWTIPGIHTDWPKFRPMLPIQNKVFHQVANSAFDAARRIHVIQSILLGLAFVSSALTALCLSQINYTDGRLRCVLFAKWSLREETRGNLNSTVDVNASVWFLDPAETEWGPRVSCHLLHFGHAVSAICSFLLLWFMILFRPHKVSYLMKQSGSTARIVLPGLIVALIAFVSCLVSSIDLILGVASWCKHLSIFLESCQEANSVHIMEEEGLVLLGDRNFVQLALAAQVFSWLAVGSWCGVTALAIYRVLAHLDFPSYFYSRIAQDDSSVELRRRNRTP